jgi:hypothetical protein
MRNTYITLFLKTEDLFDINVRQWQDITKTVPKETRGRGCALVSPFSEWCLVGLVRGGGCDIMTAA